MEFGLAMMEIVALKKIFVRNAQDGLPVTIWRELKTMQITEHPNIVELHDAFCHGSTLVLVLECMACTLADLIERTRAPFPESSIKFYIHGVLHGLAYMHSLRLLHRDIKPANVLIHPSGAVKLGDFGLARLAVQSDRTFSYQVLPTRFHGGMHSFVASLNNWSTAGGDSMVQGP